MSYHTQAESAALLKYLENLPAGVYFSMWSIGVALNMPVPTIAQIIASDAAITAQALLGKVSIIPGIPLPLWYTTARDHDQGVSKVIRETLGDEVVRLERITPRKTYDNPTLELLHQSNMWSLQHNHSVQARDAYRLAEERLAAIARDMDYLEKRAVVAEMRNETAEKRAETADKRAETADARANVARDNYETLQAKALLKIEKDNTFVDPMHEMNKTPPHFRNGR